MRREQGQAAALTVLFMTVLLLSAAAVLDVGSWFREDRDTQRVADAAALAGAQALPEDQTAAKSYALLYAGKNGGGLNEEDIEISTTVMPGDTIKTRVERSSPTFFSKIVGLESVTVGSKAAARAGVPSSARWVAPIVVNIEHPMVSCRGRGVPCFGNDTQITLQHLHRPGAGDAAGAFALLNLDRSSSGAPGAESLAGWMARGYSGWMRPDTYRSAPSTLFNSSHMTEALRMRTEDEVLFPIYDPPILGGGQNARYNIIGWIGFHIEDFDNRGNQGSVSGYFTRVIWEGILSETATTPDFGVRSIALID